MSLRPGKWALHAPIAILPFLAALVLEGPMLRQDIASRATESLSSMDAGAWAKVAVDGRDVILTGEAPSEEAAAAAEAAIAGVRGVRTVSNAVRVIQPAVVQP